MASINGIELKAIKEFRGHEYEPLVQGNIYYKGKKVGWYSQDSWGGDDHIDLDSDLKAETKNEINEVLSSYESDTLFGGVNELYNKQYNVTFKTDIFKGGTFLFGDLIQLQDYEKTYKKLAKKWNINNIAFCYKSLFDSFVKGSKLTKEEFKEELEKDKSIKLYYLFSSLEDFKVDTRKENK
jgi:hypothetical protein